MEDTLFQQSLCWSQPGLTYISLLSFLFPEESWGQGVKNRTKEHSVDLAFPDNPSPSEVSVPILWFLLHLHKVALWGESLKLRVVSRRTQPVTGNSGQFRQVSHLCLDPASSKWSQMIQLKAPEILNVNKSGEGSQSSQVPCAVLVADVGPSPEPLTGSGASCVHISCALNAAFLGRVGKGEIPFSPSSHAVSL